jgi:CheY-like chemotaxis protein
MSLSVPVVLVVEDDLDVREALEQLLLEQEYEVLTASNGVEGLAQLRARPDTRLILLDLMMPVMDGATFRKHQLADETIADVPFVLLTARTNCAELAVALGAVASFRKPCDPNALLSSIDVALKRRPRAYKAEFA